MILAAPLLLQAAAPAAPLQSPPPAVSDPVATARMGVAYPPDALLARQQGRAVVRARVAASGKLRDCRVAKSSGSAVLDKATCGAVRGWTFSPALDAEHRPVDGVFEVAMDWRLPQFPAPVSSGSPR